jgi:hypothetical protein
MDLPAEPTPEINASWHLGYDSEFKEQVSRLHLATVYGRWILVVSLWLTLGILSLWGLRYHIGLLLEHFTWAALRWGLAFNWLPSLGLFICVGMTTAVLVWQSRNILFGLSRQEQRRLEQQVLKIRQQGKSHPLWKWVCQS